METLEQKIRKNALNSGLLFGLICLVLGIFTFYFITSMVTSIWLVISGPVIFSILLPIVILIFFCIDLRKKIGGFWNFKQATTGVFIMLFVTWVISSVGTNLIFAKFIEPDMTQKTQIAVMNASISMMEKSNVDQAKIDDQRDAMQKKFDEQKNPTIGKMIEGWAIAIIFIFVFALIFGAIFKRSPLLSIDDAIDPSITTTE